MNIIKDEYGNEVDHGKIWYWAKDRRGQIVGVGKFACIIGHDEWTFFINGLGYSPDSFRYVAAEMPVFPGYCEHEVADGCYCGPCNRAYKEAALAAERKAAE